MNKNSAKHSRIQIIEYFPEYSKEIISKISFIHFKAKLKWKFLMKSLTDYHHFYTNHSLLCTFTQSLSSSNTPQKRKYIYIILQCLTMLQAFSFSVYISVWKN